MKTHAIIPIFIPHKGCPHDCVFCNQKKITARQAPVTASDVIETIETWLTTLADVPMVEIAFFGGSFTAIPMEEQNQFLSIAKSYKDRGRVQKIHLSTRPDAIDKEILDNLQTFSVDVIELGVQSFDDHVLQKSGRGHDSACVYKACQLIQEYGFELGIQLMIGLPGDSLETCIRSAQATVDIGPALARLYPTIVIDDTALYQQFLDGTYQPLSQEEAVERTKEMYKILSHAGINIIRVGLKSSDLITDGGAIAGGTFHPAFRQLVEGAIAREAIETQLASRGLAGAGGAPAVTASDTTCESAAANPTPPGGPALAASAAGSPGQTVVTCRASQRSFSNLIGNNRSNKLYFQERYPNIQFKYQVDNSLPPGEYLCQ